MRRKSDDCPAGQFGPIYNVESVSLKKFRRNYQSGADRKAYGQAVLTAVLSSQRQSAKRADVSITPPNCASGTLHNNGRDVLKAVASQQAARLAACADQIRKARTPRQWQEMYDAAMDDKRKRQAQLTKSAELEQMPFLQAAE